MVAVPPSSQCQVSVKHGTIIPVAWPKAQVIFTFYHPYSHLSQDVYLFASQVVCKAFVVAA